MISSPPNDWLLWQLADSAFPTGGFAHSGGLEAAWQHREIRNAAELESFVRASLIQLCRSMLPFITAVYDDPSLLTQLDEHCDAFLTNHVANRASRLQGRAFFASAIRIFGEAKFEQTGCVSTSSECRHLAPVFGIIAHNLNLNREQAARMFLFWHLRGWLASAVRLGLIGPLESQSLQFNLGNYAEEILHHYRDLKPDDVAQTAPLLDIWQGAQDRLYSRLFQS